MRAVILNNITESVDQLSNDTDPPLKLILQIQTAHFRKLNVLERYLFKGCVIINELTLPQGTDYLEDVIAFFGKTIDIKMYVSHGSIPTLGTSKSFKIFLLLLLTFFTRILKAASAQGSLLTKISKRNQWELSIIF